MLSNTIYGLYAAEIAAWIFNRLRQQPPEEYTLLNREDDAEEVGVRIFDFLFYWRAFQEADQKLLEASPDKLEQFRRDFPDFFRREDPENYAFSLLRGLEMRIGHTLGIREIILLAMDYAEKVRSIMGSKPRNPIEELVNLLKHGDN